MNSILCDYARKWLKEHITLLDVNDLYIFLRMEGANPDADQDLVIEDMRDSKLDRNMTWVATRFKRPS